MSDPFAAASPLDAGEREVLRALFLAGPLWDGDLPSKAGRSGLVSRGLAERYEGWQTLTREGLIAGLAFGFDREKERRNRR